MSPRRWWFLFAMTAIQSCACLLQWHAVASWAAFRERMESEYSPEVLARGHVNLAYPPGMIRAAVLISISAAFCWWWTIRQAPE